jgi:ribosomal protein S18 acetylase RimI-like enzyme
MAIALRPARAEDLDYCMELYFSGMAGILREMHVDLAAEAASIRRQWNPGRVSIITFDGADAGWIQTSDVNRESLREALFVLQLHVDPAYQRRGIGGEAMQQTIQEAARVSRAVAAGVAKINRPCLRMLEKLGFHITREDDQRFYLRIEPNGADRSHPVRDAEHRPNEAPAAPVVGIQSPVLD